MMKAARIVFLLVCSLVCAMSNAQPIASVSNINIGMSEDEFLHSPSLQGMRVMDMGWKYRGLDAGEVWRTKSGLRPQNDEEKISGASTAKYFFLLPLFPDLSHGSIAGLWMSRVNVYFYEGKLASIDVVNPPEKAQLLDTLKAKYGDAKVVNGMKIVTCQNELGAKFDHDDGTLMYRWGEGKPVVAEYRIKKWNCENGLAREYQVFDRVSYNKLRSEESRLMQAEKDNELKQKAQNSAF